MTNERNMALAIPFISLSLILFVSSCNTNNALYAVKKFFYLFLRSVCICNQKLYFRPFTKLYDRIVKFAAVPEDYGDRVYSPVRHITEERQYGRSRPEQDADQAAGYGIVIVPDKCYTKAVKTRIEVIL